MFKCFPVANEPVTHKPIPFWMHNVFNHILIRFNADIVHLHTAASSFLSSIIALHGHPSHPAYR